MTSTITQPLHYQPKHKARELPVDKYGTAHTRATCPEFHQPALGQVYDNAESIKSGQLAICADCEPRP